MLIRFLGKAMLLGWLLSACQPIRIFDEVPVLSFISMEPAVVTAGVDSIVIVLGFTDGDGDLGLPDEDTTSDVTVIDKRQGPPQLPDLQYDFRMPFVTPPGNSKQISGEVRLVIQNTFARPGLLTDTLTYEIQIRDRANRKSNVVTTPPLVINPPF